VYDCVQPLGLTLGGPVLCVGGLIACLVLAAVRCKVRGREQIAPTCAGGSGCDDCCVDCCGGNDPCCRTCCRDCAADACCSLWCAPCVAQLFRQLGIGRGSRSNAPYSFCSMTGDDASAAHGEMRARFVEDA
jgi:hypothetical protein